MACSFQKRRQRAHVVGSKNHIHPGSLFDDYILVFLSQATTNRNLQIWIGFLLRKHGAQVAVKLVVRVLTHRTGVEYHQVGISSLGLCVARRFKQARDTFRVMNVHLTAVGADLVSK